NFPTVFCLKINHDGAFTKHHKICDKGGKINLIDNIDFDAFSIYEVIDLYADHSISKELVNFDHSISKAIILYDPSKLDKFLDNDADELLDDASKNLDNVVQASKNMDNVVQASRIIDNVVQARRNTNVHNFLVSEDESKSKYRSDSDASDFIVDEENFIHDVDVDVQDFNNNTYANVEWMGCKEYVYKASRIIDNVVQARRNTNVHNFLVSEDESKSKYRSDSDASDFIVDEENFIHDVDVDVQDFNNNTYANVEWMGCKEYVYKTQQDLKTQGGFVDVKVQQVMLVLPVFVSAVKERLMLLALDYMLVLFDYKINTASSWLVLPSKISAASLFVNVVDAASNSSKSHAC
nr:transposase, MuDR [Tanacetum cinerariifolium]